jgi:chromosome segregation ATPase
MQKEMKAVHEQTAEIREILQESLKSAEGKVAEAESATTRAEERQKELVKQLADLNASQQDRAIELKVLQQRIASLPDRARARYGL